ncbi:MAG TPA: MFS transporter [Sphingobium sp.]
MSIRLDGDARQEWRDHWPVVAAAMAGVAMSTINSYSTGVFIEPLEQAFGWSRAQISMGPAITAPIIIFMGPVMGAAIDRFGPRRIGLIGVISVFLLNMLLSTVGPSIWSWFAVWGLIAIANIFIQPSVWTSAVSGMFSAGRGFALALTLSGSGIGSLVTPFLVYELTARYGWRMGYVGLALFWAVVAIPLIYFLFTSVKDKDRIAGRTPISFTPRGDGAGKRQLLSRRFIQLAVAGWLIASVVISLVTNLVPVLSSSGLTRGEAAAIAPLLGVASITGRLAIGFLLDRMRGTILAAVSVCLPIATSLLLLGLPGSVPGAAAAVLILGLALGAELDLVAYLTSRYFGLRNFGLLFGTIGGLITLAGAAGPLAMNIVYDATKSYDSALWFYIPICLAASLLFLFLGPYPHPDDLD